MSGITSPERGLPELLVHQQELGRLEPVREQGLHLLLLAEEVKRLLLAVVPLVVRLQVDRHFERRSRHILYCNRCCNPYCTH
ncbi:MAG: hypothetical protein V4719_23875, partial [Planctomycetota bacterium]